jgi:hypothetical protein
MRRITLVGTSTLIVFLAATQLSSSKLGTNPTIQDRNIVQKLYGSPVSEIYRAPQELTITASFASSGSLCRARITSDDDAGITDTQLNTVLEELAPEKVRGEFKLGTFIDRTCLKAARPKNSSPDSKVEVVVDPCHECSGVSDDYEHVNITKYGNTNQYSSVHIAFRLPECKELDNAHH